MRHSACIDCHSFTIIEKVKGRERERIYAMHNVLRSQLTPLVYYARMQRVPRERTVLVRQLHRSPALRGRITLSPAAVHCPTV